MINSSAFGEFHRKPFMIMGIVLSHIHFSLLTASGAGAGSLQPSIASLVWSCDVHAT